MAPITVDPTALSDAGVSIGAVGESLNTAMAMLTGAFNANTGQDTAGMLLGQQYRSAARELLKAVTAGINACRNLGYGVQVSALNYSRAEAASDISGSSQPLSSPPCPTPISAPAAPSSTGGGVAQPLLWSVVEFLVGDMWPNGDPAAMHAAAAAWRAFATALYGVTLAMSGPYGVIGRQQLAEGGLIKAPLRDAGTGFSSIAGQCTDLATQLEQFATNVENTQNAIRNLLNKLGSAGGIAGTIVEVVTHDDELQEIADDIETVLEYLGNEADAKLVALEQVKQLANTSALDLEMFANKEFVEFLGEDVGSGLSKSFNDLVDSAEGGLYWGIGQLKGIIALNPARFASDPESAKATWDGLLKMANLGTPAMIPAVAAQDPEGTWNLVKGLARTDGFDQDRPMVGLTQNALDILSLSVPGLGEAGVTADATSAAARAARAGDVAAETNRVTGVAGKVGEINQATRALGDTSKRTADITKNLDDIATRPLTPPVPAGGRPAPAPAQPELPRPPVTREPPAPVQPRSAATRAPEVPAETPPPVSTAHVEASHPPSAPTEFGNPPAPAPHTPAPGEHAAAGEPPHFTDSHDLGDHRGDDPADAQPPDHLPNDEVKADGNHPASSTESAQQSTGGEPVDLATGEYLLAAVDLDLPGVLPLRLTRQHRSQYRHGVWFGSTWTSTFDTRVVITATEVVSIDATGTMLTFDHPEPGRPSTPRHGRRWLLHVDEDGAGYRLEDPRSGLVYRFAPKPQLGGQDLADGILFVSAVSDRHHNEITFSYNAFGAPVSVQHSGGYHVAVSCGGGRIQQYSVDENVVRRFGYTDGDLATVTNGDGAVTEFDYDDAHRIVTWTDSIGATYSNVYDTAGRVVSQTGTDGVWAGHFTYLDDGRSRETVYVDAVGNETRHRFDDDFRPVAVTDPSGRTVLTTYNSSRDPLTVTDPAGATTTYSYNADGDPVRLTDPLGHSLDFGYVDGRRSQMIGPDGGLTLYGYDSRGNLSSVRDPGGGIHRWEYGPSGAVSAYVDPVGRRTEITCTATGFPQRIRDSLANETTFNYDAFGRVQSVRAPDGAMTAMLHDAEGRLLRRTGPDGARESWEYDGEGNCVSYSNAIGAVTRWEYGFYDLVTARVDADGGRTEYGYDLARQLVSITNPAGLTWRYEYGSDGRLASETDFNQVTTRYTYDGAGRLASRVNAIGQEIAYEYDAAGNLIAENGDGEQVNYSYDPMGNRTSAVNSSGRLDLGRDPLGRVIAETWNGRVVSHSFSDAGDLIEIRTPSGLPVQLSYDARGVADALTVAGRPCEVTTDAVGRPTRYRYGTASVDSAWDIAGRLTSRTVGTDDVGALASTGYRYRDDGVLTASGPTIRDGAALGVAARYDADVVGRLTARTLVDGPNETFGFDASENVSAGGSPRWEYRGVLLVDDGRSRYSYDRAGRLITVSTRRLNRKPDVWQYNWDAWDRLRTVVTPDGRRFEYSYDPMGRRVAKRGSDGSLTEFSWSGTRLVEEVAVAPDSSRSVTSWAYLPGELSPQIQVSQESVDHEFFALVTDQVGAPVAILDPRTGSLVGESRTTAWGLASWTGASTPWRFPGQYFDQESGLHYNLHRYYHPHAGRYITPDPLGLAPAPNPYSYPTNPTGWVDPLGLNPCKGERPDGAGLPVSGTIDPHQVRFTQDSASPIFRSGGSVASLVEGLRSGRANPADIPPIRIFEKNGLVFSLDNRRLAAFQEAGLDIPYCMATDDEIRLRNISTRNDGISIRFRGRR